MRITKKTPKTIGYLNSNIGFVLTVRQTMENHLKAISAAHRNIPALRKKASDDGVPGSPEAFNLPVIELQEDCDRMIRLVENIKRLTTTLLERDPEDWNNRYIY